MPPPEVKSGRFQLRDPSTLLLIAVIAVALSVGWLLGRVTGRAPAHKKEALAMSTKIRMLLHRNPTR